MPARSTAARVRGIARANAGSVRKSTRCSASRIEPRQTWAKPMKNRCGPVKPSITGAGLPAERFLIGRVGDRHAAQVGEVLAERQPAVDVQIVEQLRRRRIASTSLSVLAVEAGAIVGRPPVAQVALGVGAASLIVEAVRDFVADHGADAAVVHRVVGREIEERRLQNAGGEDDLVHRRVVIGVDRRRRHVPFAAIDRLAELRPMLYREPNASARSTFCDVRIGADFERRIIAPFVGIADLRHHGAELGQGLLLRLRAHPIALLDSLAIGGHEVLDQLDPSAAWRPAGNASRRKACRAPRPFGGRSCRSPASSAAAFASCRGAFRCRNGNSLARTRSLRYGAVEWIKCQRR